MIVKQSQHPFYSPPALHCLAPCSSDFISYYHPKHTLSDTLGSLFLITLSTLLPQDLCTCCPFCMNTLPPVKLYDKFPHLPQAFVQMSPSL